MTFTRRYEDVDTRYLGYKAFAEFNDELCIWDHGPVVSWGQVLRSATGALGSWTQLFPTNPAIYGNASEFDGNRLIVFNDNLFITLYRGVNTLPRVIEWDGLVVTSHLPNPQAGGALNHLGVDLVECYRRLWCLTDVTAAQANNRRIVYYYDGSSWTPITNYVGQADPTYLNHGTAAALPTTRIRHRTERLFVYNGQLYLFVTYWTGTKWSWQVWQFDAENFDRFDKIFDSKDTFDDGYVLSAVIEHEGRVKVVGNIITAGGNPTNPAMLYSSEDMVTWVLDATLATLGFPYGEVVHEGKFYLNCHDETTNGD